MWINSINPGICQLYYVGALNKQKYLFTIHTFRLTLGSSGGVIFRQTHNIHCSSKHIVFMFDKFHLMFNCKSKVSSDIFKNKNKCQLTSTFSSRTPPQCHMPSSACHFNF